MAISYDNLFGDLNFRKSSDIKKIIAVIKRDSSCLVLKDSKDKTILHHAMHNYELALGLLPYLTKEALLTKDDTGATPIHFACRSIFDADIREKILPKYLAKAEEFKLDSLNYDFDINGNNFLHTLLINHLTTCQFIKDFNEVQYVLKHAPNIVNLNCLTQYGESKLNLLSLAMQYCNYEAVDTLLEKGIKLDIGNPSVIKHIDDLIKNYEGMIKEMKSRLSNSKSSSKSFADTAKIDIIKNIEICLKNCESYKEKISQIMKQKVARVTLG